jgi:ribosomal protein S27E
MPSSVDWSVAQGTHRSGQIRVARAVPGSQGKQVEEVVVSSADDFDPLAGLTERLLPGQPDDALLTGLGARMIQEGVLHEEMAADVLRLAGVGRRTASSQGNYRDPNMPTDQAPDKMPIQDEHDAEHTTGRSAAGDIEEGDRVREISSGKTGVAVQSATPGIEAILVEFSDGTYTTPISDLKKVAARGDLVPSGGDWKERRGGEPSEVPISQQDLTDLPDSGFSLGKYIKDEDKFRRREGSRVNEGDDLTAGLEVKMARLKCPDCGDVEHYLVSEAAIDCRNCGHMWIEEGQNVVKMKTASGPKRGESYDTPEGQINVVAVGGGTVTYTVQRGMDTDGPHVMSLAEWEELVAHPEVSKVGAGEGNQDDEFRDIKHSNPARGMDNDHKDVSTGEDSNAEGDRLIEAVHTTFRLGGVQITEIRPNIWQHTSIKTGARVLTDLNKGACSCGGTTQRRCDHIAAISD